MDIARLASTMGHSHPRTISMDTVTTEGDNDSESAFPIHLEGSTTIVPMESNDKNPDYHYEIENKTQVASDFTPVAPVGPPHTGVLRGGGGNSNTRKHRDSAAVALSNTEMLRLKRSVGANPGTAHRRLSVALHPYKQQPQQQSQQDGSSLYGQQSSVLSIDSTTMHIPTAPTTNPTTTTTSLLNTSLINRTNPLQEGSLSRADSGLSLAEMMSASLTLESSTATADTSLLYNPSVSIDQSTTAAGDNTGVEAEGAAMRIVVDSLVVLPQTQVIIGKPLTYFICDALHMPV